MQAFHSFWSAPHYIRNNHHIKIPDYELLTLMLSALKWKQLNGPIKMITDSAGAAFFIENGFEDLWSEPIDTSLDGLDDYIDPFLFWAAGKLYALGRISCPCVMLDTDMIIWQDINDLFQQDVVAAHAESLSGDVYPETDVFQMRQGYIFPQEWNFSVDPVNTAFLYMRDPDLKDYYVKSAFMFMGALERADVNPAVSMCFAEQRILPMCVAAQSRHIAYLLNVQNLYQQQIVTHLWGYKSVLSKSQTERDSFCRKCIKRILLEYPEWERVLANNMYIRRHLVKYKSGLIGR